MDIRPLSSASAGLLLFFAVLNLFVSYFILPDGVFSTPQDVEYCTCTPSHAELLSNSAEAWVGDDYPEHLPLSASDPVAHVMEESIHYSILDPDAREKWASSSPKGFAFARLGPENRVFGVSMFHQYHCLRRIRAGLAGDYSPATEAHITHCLSYLRQMILCSPDLTLEPPDALERDFDVKRMGAVHVCNDWRQVYNEMANNWESWLKVRPLPAPSNITQ